MAGREGAKQEAQASARLGGELQAAQSTPVKTTRPGEHGATRPCAQGLLQGPEALSRTLDPPHQEQPCEREAVGSERRAIGKVRRGDPDQPLLG